MKILITGGAGFVGSELGKRLCREQHDVVAYDNMRFGHLDNLMLEGEPYGAFVCDDIRSDRFGAHLRGVDTVFHLAGIAALPLCQQNPGEAYDVNVAGVANVLEACRRADVRRVIFASTSAVYENTKRDRFAESDPICPDLVYACTKAAAETVCEAYARNYGMDIVIARFFNVYGPHQDVMRESPPFTSYVARELALDRTPILFNESTARRDYVYSADVVDLLVRMIHADGRFAADRFNICTGNGHSVPELYEQFLAASGKTIAATYRDPGTYWDRYPELFEGRTPLSRERIIEEVFKTSIGDPSKTHARFGWSASADIGDGIRAVCNDARRRLPLFAR
jgi:UDP-glucose 4-epimerase